MTEQLTAAALPSVGFIGLGDQGLPMAAAIAEAGYPLQYLILDMELFDAAMTASGIDAGSVTAWGLSGANRVPAVIRALNPRRAAGTAG